MNKYAVCRLCHERPGTPSGMHWIKPDLSLVPCLLCPSCRAIYQGSEDRQELIQSLSPKALDRLRTQSERQTIVTQRQNEPYETRNRARDIGLTVPKQ